jgi:nucleoside-diphosphate-sugar epimerase
VEDGCGGKPSGPVQDGSEENETIPAEARPIDVSESLPVMRRRPEPIHVTDNRKIERVLGWNPKIGVSQGYERILAWIRKNEESLRALYGSEEKAAPGL